MSLEKSELLEKLNVISERYKDVAAVKQKMDSYKPEDIYARQVEVPSFPDANGEPNAQLILIEEVEHSSNEAGTSVQQVYERVFPVPTEPIKKEFKKKDAPKGLGCAAVIALGVAIFFALGGIFGSGSVELLAWARPIIFTIAGVCVGIFGILLVANFVVIGIFNKKEDNRKIELEEQYKQAYQNYEYELYEYRQKEQAFFDAYWDWRTIFLEAVEEEERVAAQLEIDRQEAVAEIERTEFAPLKEKLDEVNDLVSDKYLPYIDKIIAFIKDGRAVTVQEAVNIIAKEIEEARALQAALKSFEESMERISEETDRIFEEQRQRQQERYEIAMEMRREEERRREWEEKDRLYKERQEAEIRESKERWAKAQERHNTVIQCNSCARRGDCRVPFTRPNCASYLPKH